MIVKAGQWYRTCQACGNVQLDKEPQGKLSTAYEYRKCKQCQSEALDYGTTRNKDFEVAGWGNSVL
jgi:hypothetical protein